MEHKNDLRGLDLFGFQNFVNEFNIDIFKENKTIDLLRPLIRKYFTKTKAIYSGLSSYGIKNVTERYLETYVTNGELIYAMHLEGFKISRGHINCCFNVSQADIRLLRNAKPILKILSVPLNRDIFDYLKYNKKFLKLKYHIKFLIETKSWSQSDLERDVLKIISKEIIETLPVVRYWTNMLQDDETNIPMGKMELLEKIFNLPPNKLVNN